MASITLRKNCPDCGVEMGGFHSNSCDVDHCRNCGGQLLGGCCEVDGGPNVWTGIWPGTLECAMYGLYSRFVDGKWTKTTVDDPEANEDLNQLYGSGKFKWSVGQQLWIRK